ncbi:MAG: hypothetical protein CMJ18_23910, partial [Phycisphaeraceae bacterium]|nr:hypothetical protein [Phycisphaeraceae bacterium]
MLARPKRLLVGAMIALAAMPFAAAFGQDFPPGPVDDPPTVSSAIIFFKVDPLFRPLMVEPSGFSYPGYRETSATLESPWLTDPATTIGRSAPHVDGDAADLGGAPVGSRGTIVSDSDIVFPAGFEGPAGTREVHTEIASLHLQDDDGLIAVRGGAMAPNRPRSLGEVESQGTGTDFPADSFFSVFAAIDLPPHPIRQVPGFENVGFPGATIHNPLRDPLIVQHPGITEFPPRAEYNHSGLAFQQPQPRVDLLFSSEMPGLWNEGQRFGQLILATHGMSFDANNPIDLFELNIILANLEQAPPDDPGTVGDVQITGDAGDWDLVDQSFIPAGDPQSHLQLPTLNADERSNSLDPYDMQLTV